MNIGSFLSFCGDRLWLGKQCAYFFKAISMAELTPGEKTELQQELAPLQRDMMQATSYALIDEGYKRLKERHNNEWETQQRALFAQFCGQYDVDASEIERVSVKSTQ